MTETTRYDVVIIGFGGAALSAAVSALETLGPSGRIALLERTPRDRRGGNTQWTGAYFRLEDVYTPAAGFCEDAATFSGGYANISYWENLVANLPDTMEWLQSKGLRFHDRTRNFLSKSRPRIAPVGGGEAIVRTLGRVVEEAGTVDVLYETTATDLLESSDGSVVGVRVRSATGQVTAISARTVIIASGGFEGNPELMARYFDRDVFRLRTLAPGGMSNKGEGIEMALRVGAAGAGQWDAFHAALTDPRSEQADAVISAFPYGLLVNSAARRFVDEASGTVDEIYEAVAREVRAQRDGIAFFVADRKLKDVPNIEHAMRTEKKPFEADTIRELASQMGVSADELESTVLEYNATVPGQEIKPDRLDGVATEGLPLPKSNWAAPLDDPPFVAYPVACTIVFTFGGIATNLQGEVVTADGIKIPGLYAAGECTGVYLGKYLGATSVMRSLIYGRIAGRSAAQQARAHELSDI